MRAIMTRIPTLQQCDGLNNNLHGDTTFLSGGERWRISA
jgi:hypothetical protein